jgi:hypothetical protein
MAQIKFSASFLKDSLGVLKERGLKALLLGQHAKATEAELELVNKVESNYHHYKAQGARRGKFKSGGKLHRGRGTCYLVKHSGVSSWLLFSSDTHITNGPDLWVYLSRSTNPKTALKSYLDLGLLSGNKGAQAYRIKKPIAELSEYNSVIIHCKQFDVLFSFAILK